MKKFVRVMQAGVVIGLVSFGGVAWAAGPYTLCMAKGQSTFSEAKLVEAIPGYAHSAARLIDRHDVCHRP